MQRKQKVLVSILEEIRWKVGELEIMKAYELNESVKKSECHACFSQQPGV